MKLSTIKTDNKGEHLNQWELTKFIERIQKDANNNLIGTLREETTPNNPEHYRRYNEIPRVYAAAELYRQQNGALGVAQINGLVVLEVHQLMSDKRCRDVKLAAMTLPSTVAAFTGATGNETIILVSVARTNGSVPVDETEAETFYEQAYNVAASIYDSILPVCVTRMTPSLRHSFLMPLDEEPLVHSKAAPLHIPESGAIGKAEGGKPQPSDDHLLALPEQRSDEEIDITAYHNYERSYNEVLPMVMRETKKYEFESKEYYTTFIVGMAKLLFDRGWPEEEVVCHMWRHLQFANKPGLTEELVRTLISTTYNNELALQGRLPKSTIREPLMQQIVRRMESRYMFRYNTIMGYPEYRPNATGLKSWLPVTDKVINTFTSDLQISGLNVWDRDVRRYINSTRVRDFNPVMHYLHRLCPQWDGRDYISELAHTVPTKNPEQWAKWFHTWFLGMVAQWMGRNRNYGNAVAPLLISPQGMKKSTFCRSLLPPELRSWGYNDNLSLADERTVHLAMAQTLLINLDEFNRISPAKQQGFLKNILQLPSVKVKRPYARHTEEIPRLASFIATTNLSDVLTDPTGSRRFIGIEVTGSIDVSQRPNYGQLYAQAQAEINAGVRSWFDDEETQAIMEHNRQFQRMTSAEMYFHKYFDIPAEGETDGEWILTTDILTAIDNLSHGTCAIPAANVFSRTLHAIPGIKYRHTNKGGIFYVRKVSES